MKVYLITAMVLGEKVTLYNQMSSNAMVNEWLKENEPRLTEKGFSAFEVDSYYMDEEI